MAIAFVTGTSTGIGAATAVSLARAGHTVYAGMRNPHRQGELHEAVARENLDVHIVAHDVDDDSSAKAAIVAAGRIDVLVNNAGIGVMGSLEETPLSQFRSAMETNYFGALRCIQAVLPGCANDAAAASSMSRRWPDVLRWRLRLRTRHRSGRSKQ